MLYSDSGLKNLVHYLNYPSWFQHVFTEKGPDMFSSLCTKLWILKDNLKEDARGVSALEYAILIAIVIGAVVVLLNTGALDNIFGKATEALDNVSDKLNEE